MWATLRLEIAAADSLARPHIDGHGLPYEAARALVQAELDASPGTGARKLAGAWRAGPKDDTVFAGTPNGLSVWALVEHDDADPRGAVMAWCEDFAATIRSTGMDVQVARW